MSSASVEVWVNSMSLQHRCAPCAIAFESYEDLEKHYVHAHLDMTNEPILP
jgi:hypothetical protein